MEEKHRDLLLLHRSKFAQSVDVERLIPFLQATDVLSSDDTDEIRHEGSSSAKVQKLLDILPVRGNQAFQTLCLSLETTYPHLLTVMFLGNSTHKVSESSTTVLTSDSEVEDISKLHGRDKAAVSSVSLDPVRAPSLPGLGPTATRLAGNRGAKASGSDGYRDSPHIGTSRRGRSAREAASPSQQPRLFRVPPPISSSSRSHSRPASLPPPPRPSPSPPSARSRGLSSSHGSSSSSSHGNSNTNSSSGQPRCGTRRPRRRSDLRKSSNDSAVRRVGQRSDTFSLDFISSHPESFGSQDSTRLFSTPSPLSPSEYDLQQNNLALLKAELKLVTHDRDSLRKELRKVQTERDVVSRRLAMNSGEPSLSRLGTLTKQHAGVSNSDKSLSASRDYDRLKSQCDQAMSELQSLRLRCDAAMRDSEFYRSKHRQAMSKLDKQQTEALSLRTQYNEILADKHRLEQEVANLQKFREEDRKEVADLRKHQQEAINENGNSEAINQMYITTLRKYEAIKDDYDSLRKRYTDLYASRSATVSKLELAQEEVSQLKKQYEEVIQDRNGIVRERNGLKQQCTAAIHQWDNALRELNEVKEALAKVQQQRDEAMKEINQAMAVRIKATKDLARLTEERNAAVQEYSLVMLERDSVHKEIEKLQEELTEANKKVKNSDLQKKVTVEEIETLRREIASALHDRDRALKECNDLREKYGDYVTARDDGNSRERDEVRRDYDAYRRELARKSRSESLDRQDSSSGSLGANDSYSKGQKERLENLDVANQEIDRLRKQLEKLQTELNEAQQEAEVSKRRRDWAFSERDKIVLERESIRTLCDKLRRERDRAVSDLAEALRDSDDIKKQRNEASKELKELREKIEAQMEKESRMKQLNTVSHNHSRDSAIDADLQEWETETLEFDMGGSSLDALGFDLAGGKDDSQYPDSSIFISSITKGSVADGKLKVSDTIVRVNNVDLTNADKSKVYDAVKNGGGVINMVVRRRRATSSRFVQTVHLNLSGSKDHGINLETGLYISRIAQGSVAAKEGNLAVGDRVISIGGKSVDTVKSSSEGLKILESAVDVLTLLVAKSISNPSAPVSSSSSGHNIVENIDGEKMNGPCNYSSSPVKEPSKAGIRDLSKKLTNSSSQTEDVHLLSKKQSSVSSAPHPSQTTFLDRAYNKIFRERRSGKERHEKKVSRNSSPSPVHEEEAIAELDSIIEHFKKNTPSSSKGSKGRKRKEKETEKNGGTWPRYRSAPPNYVEQCRDTMMNSHRKKERTSIASLMHPPKFWPAGMYSSKTPEERDHGLMGRSPPTDASSSDPGGPVYSVLQHGPQSSEASVMHALKTGPFLSNGKSPFYPPSPGNLPSTVDGKATESSRHYSPVSSLDSPLDYSVVSADKTVLEYYRNKGKTRPKSAHYPQSDSESFSATDSPTSVKPSSLDILSPYSKPLHLSSSSMSSGRGVMSPHLNERPTQHVRASSQSTPQSSLLRSPPNGMAYFPVSGGRVHHSHTSHTHPHNTISCTSPTSSSPRYSSPPTVAYTSRSGESLLSSSIPETSPVSDPRLYPRLEGRYSHNPSTSSSPYSFSHSPSQSIELQHYHPAPGAKRLVPKHSHAPYREELSGYGSYDGPSTFPKRTNQQRIRIPSNQSVTSTKSSAGKVSTSSIEKASASERGSPMPAFLVEVVNPGTGAVTSSMPDFRNKKVAPGALRSICIQKSAEPLGIQIDCGSRGGIFVSSVSENSLASQAGLQIGDQLLEVCGINMRSATYLLAANVLRQCGDSITMLVQYSPDKFKEAIGSSTSSSSSTGSSTPSDGSPAPTPTPSSSPKTPHKQSKVVDLTDSLPPSATSTLTRPTNSAGTSITDEQSGSNGAMHEPRRVFLKKSTSNLGVSLLGGNAVGIFVHAVQPDSPASGSNGLRCGDQILEYNGADLRSATAEQAASELAKPADTVSILAQYNYARYLEIQGQAGDSFYIRAMFDRTADSPDELSFRKDAILYVDNTMLNGVSGMWRAWLVNEDGQKRQCGVIPSKYKVDEELLLKRSLGDLDSDSGSRRGSTSARRSFFRRKKHQRSNSRDSKELASFSDVSINSYSDSGTLAEDPSVATYQRVERLDYLVLRPVLIVGPLIEVVVDKLVQDFPHKFQRCLPEIFRGSQQLMEKGIQDHIFVDYRRRGSHFECITVAAVKEICDKNTHCIIDVSPQSVERLHRLQIYPIVLFIKFKSTKQIREVKDSTFLTEKVSTKAAKEMYEHSLKIESEYKHVISAVIPGGCLAYMCAQIEAYVDQEQSKTLWVPAGTI